MEAVKPPRISHEARALRLEHLPDCLVAHLRMRVRAGIIDALLEQQGVQFVKVLDPQARREKSLAHQPDLVLDLPLLPT